MSQPCLFPCHPTDVSVMIGWFHSAMAYKLNMTSFLWFPGSRTSRDDLEISDRQCLTFYSSSTHVILIDYFSRPPFWASECSGSIAQWICVLWTRQSLVIRSWCLYFTDKWIWQKNCLGKAIPQASQQFLPSFFTSIEEGKARLWLPFLRGEICADPHLTFVH